MKSITRLSLLFGKGRRVVFVGDDIILFLF